MNIKEEVVKQSDAGFLEVTDYPEWLGNIMPVPKKDGKARMCMDYCDLTKLNPNDDCLLPHIDVLVDNEQDMHYSLLCMVFSGYNQIQMAPKDCAKTSS